MEAVLEIQNLSVEYYSRPRNIRVVEDVELQLARGESIGIVGESACGKSTLVQSVLNLLNRNEGGIVKGKIIFEDKDIVKLKAGALNKIRGKRIAYIPQDPFSSLNPVMTIGEQIYEALASGTHKTDMYIQSVEILKKVHIKNPEEVLKSYPHQLSGGMRQRVLIAMAVVFKPAVLIADEPTTALDVTIQKEILDLIDELSAAFGMSVIYVTHNIGIIFERTKRVYVMYAGRIVEEIQTHRMIKNSKHPYTQALIKAVPVLGSKSIPDILPGAAPDYSSGIRGCRFYERCIQKMEVCSAKEPVLKEHLRGKVRCWLYE